MIVPPNRVVLVVDDDEAICAMVKSLLTDEGYVATGVTSGTQALHLMEEIVPDLLVLDLGMPDTDGFNVIEALQTHPRTKDVPVVIITAMQPDRLTPEQKAIASKAVAYIVKPFDVDVLLNALEKGLGITLS